jgi:hypothetical protein
LAELQIAKQAALTSEDYPTATQLKEKIAVVQTQIAQVEDRFTTDILQNTITSWQNELSNSIQEQLNGMQKVNYTISFVTEYITLVPCSQCR